ncbi:MAG: hypothetical protein K9H48_14290 [Melioribacteraceae bacterium]|nr:hypothetical protein [Melioribacteraceae bacterium]MCF8395121.1 hypothetical protein [Melioribacteraceae bacterium]MCF8420530.1 hypothetical protein [Melioribacteraceae bacterium]
MKKQNMLKTIDSISRYLSLIGLLGLAGFAGLFNPEYFRWSFLSYLSFISYLRFINLLIIPNLIIKTEWLRIFPFINILAALAPLASDFPGVGFMGFLGFLAFKIEFIHTDDLVDQKT